MASYVEHGPDYQRAETEKKKKPDKYPPREGFVVVTNAGGNGGYLYPFARPCKCGGSPKFQQIATEKLDVAETFVGMCTKCGRRTVTEGPLEKVLNCWNRRRFTYDSELVSGELKDPSPEGLMSLCNCVINAAIGEAIELLQRYHELKQMMADDSINESRKELFAPELSQIKGNLQSYQHFFETSPLMYERDPESVLSDIRRAIHPDLKPDERLKIPLNLVSM